MDKKNRDFIRFGAFELNKAARSNLKHKPVRLDDKMRSTAQASLEATCKYRGWELHALSVSRQHIHIVVTADDKSTSDILRILKSYTSRDLNKLLQTDSRPTWWTRSGSVRNLRDAQAVRSAVQYVDKQK